MKKKLAKITRANLEIKERGILNFRIDVNYEDGFSQGVGGIALDKYDEKKKRRVGTAYGCEMIRRLLLTLDVNDFNEMTGKHVWIFGENEGLDFTPKGIGPLQVDVKSCCPYGKEPVMFDDVLSEFTQE